MAVIQVKMLMDFILRILENGLRHEYIYSSDAFGILEFRALRSRNARKHTVVIGRSHIVGRPMSILMGRKGFPTQQ
jgi:5,10-methylene-tetrahydrofolate dehydrogenase/methenyl tetrahydrofolate cyclohydrolase